MKKLFITIFAVPAFLFGISPRCQSVIDQSYEHFKNKELDAAIYICRRMLNETECNIRDKIHLFVVIGIINIEKNEIDDFLEEHEILINLIKSNKEAYDEYSKYYGKIVNYPSK